MKSIVKLMPQVAVAVILASAIAMGQGRSSATGTRGSRPRGERALRQLERELNIMMSEETAPGPAERRGSSLAVAQISEDFMRIQVVNNDLAQALSRGGALDLKFIAKSAAEIRKRATQLKANLALPKPEQESKPTRTSVVAEPDQLKSALSALDELIISFVSNPVFQSVNVVDAQLSAQARRNLEEIIELSGQVKKRSEQLHKAAEKSQ